jgi:ubiquinone/menaquinone biosynthesis C-methylase UbiE
VERAGEDDHSHGIRAYYDRPSVRSSYGSELGLWSSERRLVDRYVPPGSSVLDVGCGAGRVAIALARLGYRASGLDLSDGMIDTARSLAGAEGLAVDFVVGDARKLPYADGAFDASIFACNGIGHLRLADQQAAVREMQRVTRPGGHVIISFRNPYGLTKLAVGLARNTARSFSQTVRRAPGPSRDEWVDHGIYVHRPSRWRMERTVRESGLEIVLVSSHRFVEQGREASPLAQWVGGEFFVVARVPA